MPYTNFEFPNASYYNEDLRELVRLYKELKATYDNLQDEIADLYKYIENFETNTQQIIVDQITVTMSLYQQRLLSVEKLVKDLELTVSEFQADISKFQPQINQINADIKSLTNYFQNLHNELIEELHEYKNSLSQYNKDQLEVIRTELINTVTTLNRLDVTNPVNGKFEDINIALHDIYEAITISWGMTAGDYDEMRLTALEYDRLHIKAIDYSTKAYFIFWEQRVALMRSPFTGLYANFKDVIQMLANLHKDTYTAAEYDAMQMTAGQFDIWKATAYNYDWFGKQVVLKSEGITAGQYDSMKWTAEKFDSERITPYMYDNYGNAYLHNLLITVCSCQSKNPAVLQPTIGG